MRKCNATITVTLAAAFVLIYCPKPGGWEGLILFIMLAKYCMLFYLSPIESYSEADMQEVKKREREREKETFLIIISNMLME